LLVALITNVAPRAGVPSVETRAAVVYDEVATELAGARVEGAELWVTTEDLTRATRFELKPQGVCRDELCFPLPKERRGEFVREESGKRWFHLTEFARLVQQPVAHDAGASAWYFGLRGDQRAGLTSLKAPTFTLPDMAGKMHSLADFAASGGRHGKKVLLVTWASW
jgi:hypothetical protein